MPEKSIVFAVGDIVDCDNSTPGKGAIETAKLLNKLLKEEGNEGALVLLLGDLVYDNGTEGQIANCYDQTWGQFYSRSLPTPGNHEYYALDSAGKDYSIGPYQQYWDLRFQAIAQMNGFAGVADEGYYKFQHASWTFLSINSTAIVEDADTLEAYPLSLINKSNEPPHIKKWKKANLKIQTALAGHKLLDTYKHQQKWLNAEAFKNNKECTLVFTHYPRYSSGKHGNEKWETDPLIPVYRMLIDNGVSVVLAGHDHDYERFHPMDEKGVRDDMNGITSCVVGTGGTEHRDFENIINNSAKRVPNEWGILRLELYSDHYNSQFITTTGKRMDSHTEKCVPRAQ